MIENMLDKLSEIQSAADALRMEYNEKRLDIMAAVQDALDDLDAEYQPKLDAASENAATITEAVKAAVLEYGASVKGTYLHAVYTKPRVTWESKLLEGYAVAHPEILAARKEGAASVSIRGAK